MERCPDCGFAYDLDRARESGGAIIVGTGELAELLAGTDGTRLRARPQADVWSPLEYGCHLRDALSAQRERVLLARRVERPTVVPMGRDERVEHDGYADQEVGAVIRQLNDAARLLANVLDRLGPDDWGLTVIYNYPASAERDIRWLAVHAEHEVHHHLLDVDRQLS